MKSPRRSLERYQDSPGGGGQRNDWICQVAKETQQPFNGLCSGTTWVGRYQKKQSAFCLSIGLCCVQAGFPTSCLLDFYGAGEDNGGRGTDSLGGRHPNRTNGAPTPTTPLRFFTGRMPFLQPNQQRQSTEGTEEMDI